MGSKLILVIRAILPVASFSGDFLVVFAESMEIFCCLFKYLSDFLAVAGVGLASFEHLEIFLHSCGIDQATCLRVLCRHILMETRLCRGWVPVHELDRPVRFVLRDCLEV